MHDERATAALLRHWVRDDFGLELTVLERIHHGADTAAQVWRGGTADVSSYAVKWSGRGSPAGLTVPGCLAARGVPGVVAPCVARNGSWWSDRQGRRLSVTPWATDERALDRELGPRFWTAFGAMLAQVHAIEPDDRLAAMLPQENHRPDHWVGRMRAVDAAISELGPDDGGTTDDMTAQLREIWHAAADVIVSLVGTVEELAPRLWAQPAPIVVCHGDAHVGNVLVRGGDEFWLIDWDDAVLAPRERDLLFVLDGVLFFRLVTAQEQAWFFDGYGDVDVEPARLTYYRCLRTFEDAVEPAEQVLDSSLQRHERRAALEIVRGVFSPSGLARQALSPQDPRRTREA